MKKYLSSLLVAALVGVNLAVPLPISADELPLCSEVADPTTTPCTGPTEPTGSPPPCSEVPDPTTMECTGPTDAEPIYDWVWNGTSWVAEGYPWIFDGTEWVPAPEPVLEATVSETGPDSTNTSTASDNDTVTVNENNEAAISNNISATLETGENSVLYNTLAGDLTSGNVRMSVDLINFINSVTALGGGTVTMADIAPQCAELSGECDLDLTNLDPRVLNAILAYYVGGIFDIIARNTDTGPGSTNTSTVSDDDTTTLNSSDSSSIDNAISLAADTGNNVMANNTAVGDLTTGNIDAALNIVNIINSILSVPTLDLVMLNVFGDLFGNIFLPESLSGGECAAGGCLSLQGGGSAGNSNTGPDSTNVATSSDNDALTLNSTNEATISNDVALNANTGGNTVEGNTLAGNVTTGAIDVQLSLIDCIFQGAPGACGQGIGDSWFMVFVNVLGQWTGEILGINPADGSVVVLSGPTAQNSNTGPNSTNIAQASDNDSLTVNADNTAAINNSLTLDLNTGNNTVTQNTQAGNLTTGDITVVGNVVNIINQAVNLSKHLFLGFINIMGDWTGSLGPRSAFPVAAVGGNPDNTTEGSFLTAPSLLPEEPGVAPNTMPRLASSRTSDGEIAGGVSTAQASETSAIPLLATTPAAEEGATAPWQQLSLVLFGAGALLLIIDTLQRRRLAR